MKIVKTLTVKMSWKTSKLVSQFTVVENSHYISLYLKLAFNYLFANTWGECESYIGECRDLDL